MSYGLEYSYENYSFNTWDEYGTEDESIITQQTQKRKNYNFFFQLDRSFENSFLTFGIGSNKINYNWVEELSLIHISEPTRRM